MAKNGGRGIEKLEEDEGPWAGVRGGGEWPPGAAGKLVPAGTEPDAPPGGAGGIPGKPLGGYPPGGPDGMPGKPLGG